MGWPEHAKQPDPTEPRPVRVAAVGTAPFRIVHSASCPADPAEAVRADASYWAFIRSGAGPWTLGLTTAWREALSFSRERDAEAFMALYLDGDGRVVGRGRP